MKRSAVAQELAAHLFEAEAAIDTAFVKIGLLAQALPEARIRAGMAATVGQHAFEQVVQSMNAQVQSRSAMVALHEELARLKKQSVFRQDPVFGGSKSDEPVPRPSALAVVNG